MDNKFYVGQRVKCPNFGKGEVITIDDISTFCIGVYFDSKTTKHYMSDGRLYPIFMPTLEPDEPEVIEWPEGANYLATDHNNERWFYEFEPKIIEKLGQWNMDYCEDGRSWPLKVFNENWRESLIKREQ